MSWLRSHKLESYNIASDCESLCQSSVSVDCDVDWEVGPLDQSFEARGRHPDSGLFLPGGVHLQLEREVVKSAPSSPISWAVDSESEEHVSILVDYWAQRILEESEMWMRWIRQGHGMPSQLLWEALLVELCRLGQRSQAKHYLIAGALLGCRPTDWTRLAKLCGAEGAEPESLEQLEPEQPEQPELRQSASASSTESTTWAGTSANRQRGSM